MSVSALSSAATSEGMNQEPTVGVPAMPTLVSLMNAFASCVPVGVRGPRAPVAADHVQVAGRIDRESAAPLPQATVPRVGIGHVGRQRPDRRRRRVEAQDPPVVVVLVAVRRESHGQHALGQRQPDAVLVLDRIEHDLAAGRAVARAIHRQRLSVRIEAHVDRAAGLVYAGRQIQRVQQVFEGAVGVALRGQIDGVRRGIDDRRAADPDQRLRVHAGRRRHPRRLDAGARPQQIPGAVGVERVDVVRLGGDVDDVLAGDRLRDVQRLRVDLPGHRVRMQLAEAPGVNVRRGEDRLAQVRARARQIVVLGQHAGHRREGSLDRRHLGLGARPRLDAARHPDAAQDQQGRRSRARARPCHSPTPRNPLDLRPIHHHAPLLESFDSSGPPHQAYVPSERAGCRVEYAYG